MNYSGTYYTGYGDGIVYTRLRNSRERGECGSGWGATKRTAESDGASRFESHSIKPSSTGILSTLGARRLEQTPRTSRNICKGMQTQEPRTEVFSFSFSFFGTRFS